MQRDEREPCDQQRTLKSGQELPAPTVPLGGRRTVAAHVGERGGHLGPIPLG